MTLHSSIRAQKRAAAEPSPTPKSKVRVVGGGGVTNTAQNKEEKRAGYSPSKVKPFEIMGEPESLVARQASPLKRRKSLPESPTKQIQKTIEVM